NRAPGEPGSADRKERDAHEIQPLEAIGMEVSDGQIAGSKRRYEGEGKRKSAPDRHHLVNPVPGRHAPARASLAKRKPLEEGPEQQNAAAAPRQHLLRHGHRSHRKRKLLKSVTCSRFLLRIAHHFFSTDTPTSR